MKIYTMAKVMLSSYHILHEISGYKLSPKINILLFEF